MDSFIDEALVRQSRLPIEVLTVPCTILDLDGKPFTSVSNRIRPLTLILSGNHLEQICLDLIPSSAAPTVLGSPWLACHTAGLAKRLCNRLERGVSLVLPSLGIVPPPLHVASQPIVLAVVLALQKLRHWLEGSALPFVVWTDSKNLAYLHSAKRLNSRQA